MDKITKEVLGKRIRDLREFNKKSQEELGKFLGKSHAAISDIERGKSELSVTDLTTIANYFDVAVETLLNVSTSTTSANNSNSFSHHRAESGMSKDEVNKMLKAREDFRKKAREQAEKNS